MATDAGTFSGAVPAARMHRRPVSSRVAMREFAGLGLLIAVVAVGLGSLTTLVSVPSVFGDELSYWEAARSVASGDGFSIRGGGFGTGRCTRLFSRRSWACSGHPTPISPQSF